MKLGYLLLNLATVGGGILIYDLVRKDGATSGTHEDVAPVVSREGSVEAPPSSSEGPRLTGVPNDEVLRRLENLERRVRDAESRPGSVAVVEDGGSRTPGAAPAGSPAATDVGSDDPGVATERRGAFEPPPVEGFPSRVPWVGRQRPGGRFGFQRPGKLGSLLAIAG